MRTSVRIALTLAALVPARSVVQAQSIATFRAAARYSAERDGDAVLIFRHDSLLLESYAAGGGAEVPHELASGTKSFSCAIAALAVSDSLLALDEPVARLIPAWTGDPLKRRVTIRDLLSLTSGIRPERAASATSFGDSPSLPMIAPPGREFHYGAPGFDIFEEALRHALKGQDVVAYFTRRVLAPLGITVRWQRDAFGIPNLSDGASVTALDWGRFGLLLLHEGVWRGTRLLPAGPLAACRRGSAANPGYGLGLWLNAATPATPPPPGVTRAGPEDRRINASDVPRDLALAAGSGGQRLYVLPAQGMVMVRLGHNTGPEFKDSVFVRTALGRQAPRVDRPSR